jgi:hypothetical protein
MADAGLARLTDHARYLLRLQRIFDSATPLTRLARISNVRLGKIFIVADSSATAAKLRQMEPRLTRVFQAEAPEVTGIEIRVQPGRRNPPPTETRMPATIAPERKRGLTLLAERMPEGSPLRAALLRLVESAK